MTCVELEYVILGDILSNILSYFNAYRTTCPLIQIQVRTIVNDTVLVARFFLLYAL